MSVSRVGSLDEALNWAREAHKRAVEEGIEKLTIPLLREYLKKVRAPFVSESFFRRHRVSNNDLLKTLNSSTPSLTFTNDQLIEMGPGITASGFSKFAWEDGFAKLHEAHEERKKQQRSEVYRTVHIKVDRPNEPIVVLTLGDMHFGSPSVDYPRLAWVLQLLQRTDIKVVAIFVGDVCDQMIWPGVRNEGRASPLSVHKEVLTAIGWMRAGHKYGRIVGGVCGNHDLVSEKMAGLSTFLLAMEETKIPFAKHEMLVDIHVDAPGGSQSYLWEIRHACRGSSIYQRAAGPVRHNRNNHRDAEFVVSGHLHKSAFYDEERHGKKRYSIQVGTYKDADLDEYAVENGWERGDNEADFGVFLWPNEHRVEIMKTRSAIEFLEALAVASKVA